MKKYLGHDKHYKAILFQAAVITLLFHVAMLYSFVYEPPPKKTKQSTGRKIAMFTAVSNDSEQNLAMARWLEYHNPGLIARPDYVNGYGAVSRRPKMRIPIKDRPKATLPAPAIPPPKKFESLVGGAKTEVDKNSRLVGYQTLAIRPLKPVVHKSLPQNYPLFKLPNGNYVGGVLTIEELKYRNLSAKKTTGNTMLKVVIPTTDMMPRIKIKKSCGIAKLDNLAVRKLLLNRKKLLETHSKPGNPLQFTIIWREVKR